MASRHHKSSQLKTKHKFKTIPQDLRLQWLQRQVIKAMDNRRTSVEGRREYLGKRYAFSILGPELMEGQACYVCGQGATIRHHITPLILGGNNKFSNLVPLCHDCHVQVHEVGPRKPQDRKVKDDDPGVVRIKTLLKSMYG